MNRLAAILGATALLAGCAADDPMTDSGFSGAGQSPGAGAGMEQSDLGGLNGRGLGPDAEIEGGSLSDPTSKAYFTTVVGDRVFFATDSSTLTSEARAVLDKQAEWLRRNPSRSVTIEGHADERGTREYNLGLGARRANAVKSYLSSLGIASGRLKTVSYGKERPVALCSKPRCWSKNRRSVSVLVDGNYS